jgi:hypothetical protein
MKCLSVQNLFSKNLCFCATRQPKCLVYPAKHVSHHLLNLYFCATDCSVVRLLPLFPPTEQPRELLTKLGNEVPGQLLVVDVHSAVATHPVSQSEIDPGRDSTGKAPAVPNSPKNGTTGKTRPDLRKRPFPPRIRKACTVSDFLKAWVASLAGGPLPWRRPCLPGSLPGSGRLRIRRPWPGR